MSKILFLGASAFQLAPIKYAKSVGHHTIVCDYLPDAPGHKIADEGFVTSTTDKEAVLKLAKDCHVHAVIAYASDPAAPVAAYVCDKLGLPGNPVEAVDTMTYKDKWREFQRIHDFPCPIGFGSSPYFPVIVKPVDSSGSKGVSIVHHDYEYESAVAYALTHSRKGKFVCESLVEKDGYQIAGDAFVVDGRVVFHCLANEHFEGGCLVPIGESFPYIGSSGVQRKVVSEIQRAITLLGFKNGSINLDIRISGGDVYLMEIGARAGGNMITEAIELATGVNLAEYVVKAALGEDCSGLKQKPCLKNIATYMVHSSKQGKYEGITIDMLEGEILKANMLVNYGDPVEPFTGSNRTLGTMIIEFPNVNTMLEQMDTMSKRIRVIC